MDLSELRREYARAGLHENELAASPFEQFSTWYQDISGTDTLDPTAMVLATAGTDGHINQRIVLLKSFSEKGFVFYSNYQSQKGLDIASNMQVSLLFAWHVIDRQVIVRGTAEKLTEAQSDEYFASRPRGSQIAATISAQSNTIESRELLESKFRDFEDAHRDKSIKRPEHWGGYQVAPSRFEFWQGRESRLHDRLIYSLNDNAWTVSRLAP